MYTVVDFQAEGHDGLVNRVRVGEPYSHHWLLTAAAHAALSIPNCIGNLVLNVLGEIDTFRVRKHALKRLDESELDERSSDTDSANEKAHERGRVMYAINHATVSRVCCCNLKTMARKPAVRVPRACSS